MIPLRKLNQYSFLFSVLKIVIGVFRSDQIDHIHDQNTAKFIECIQTSHDVCGVNNLVAIKITALIRPNVLKKFNIMLKSLKDRSLLPPLFELINQEQSNENTVTVLQQSVNSPLIKDQVVKHTGKFYQFLCQYLRYNHL